MATETSKHLTADSPEWNKARIRSLEWSLSIATYRVKKISEAIQERAAFARDVASNPHASELNKAIWNSRARAYTELQTYIDSLPD